MTSRLNKLEKELVDQVAYDLSYPDIKRSSCVTCVGHLVDLGQAQLASQKFLAARHELLQQRSRMISYLGDVPAYISELGVVMFTILKHTADWYLTAFRENRMISSQSLCWLLVSWLVCSCSSSYALVGLVQWAEVQVHQFAETFRRQVYGPTSDPVVIEESLRITAHHNRKVRGNLEKKTPMFADVYRDLHHQLLRDSGLDFTFLLATLLQPNWNEADVKPNSIIAETEVQKSERPPNPRQETMERIAKAAVPAPSQPVDPSAYSSAPAPAIPRPPPRSERRARAPPKTEGRI